MAAVVALAPGMKLPRTSPVIGSTAGGGDRNRHPHPSRRYVPLPSHPQQREALPHERAVAELRGGGRIGRVGGVLEDRQDPLAAAVAGLVEEAAVAAPRIHRFQQVEVRRELDQALRVLRGAIEVDDGAVLRQPRVEREVHPADEFLVGAGGTERRAVQHRLAADDLEAGHAGVGRRHQQRGHDHRKKTSGQAQHGDSHPIVEEPAARRRSGD